MQLILVDTPFKVIWDDDPGRKTDDQSQKATDGTVRLLAKYRVDRRAFDSIVADFSRALQPKDDQHLHLLLVEEARLGLKKVAAQAFVTGFTKGLDANLNSNMSGHILDSTSVFPPQATPVEVSNDSISNFEELDLRDRIRSERPITLFLSRIHIDAFYLGLDRSTFQSNRQPVKKSP